MNNKLIVAFINEMLNIIMIKWHCKKVEIVNLCRMLTEINDNVYYYIGSK